MSASACNAAELLQDIENTLRRSVCIIRFRRLAGAVGDQFSKRSQSTRLCHVILVLGAIGI